MRIHPKLLTIMVTIAGFTAAAGLITQANACSCLAPAEAFEKTENAFIGQIISTEKCRPKRHGLEAPKIEGGFFGRVTGNMFRSYTCYRVSVVDELRGETGDWVTVVGKTNPEGAACEASYVVGAHVLFLESGKGPYWANICSSFPVGKDATLLKELETKHSVTFDIEGVYKTESPAPETE